MWSNIDVSWNFPNVSVVKNMYGSIKVQPISTPVSYYIYLRNNRRKMCLSPEITRDGDHVFIITFAIHELSSRYLKDINFIQFEKFWVLGTFEIFLSFFKNRTFSNVIEIPFSLKILHFGEKNLLWNYLFSHNENRSHDVFLFQ